MAERVTILHFQRAGVPSQRWRALFALCWSSWPSMFRHPCRFIFSVAYFSSLLAFSLHWRAAKAPEKCPVEQNLDFYAGFDDPSFGCRCVRGWTWGAVKLLWFPDPERFGWPRRYSGLYHYWCQTKDYKWYIIDLAALMKEMRLLHFDLHALIVVGHDGAKRDGGDGGPGQLDGGRLHPG